MDLKENLYDVVSWAKLKKFLLNFYFNIFKFNKIIYNVGSYKLLHNKYKQ